MKKLFLVFIFIVITVICNGQLPHHLYQHDFPLVNSQNPKIVEMLNQITENQIVNDIEHLSSYLNRRADAVYIYEVKDWLVSQYESLDIDSIQLHEFVAIPHGDSVPIITAPNVLAYQIGKKTPNEFVICGAHYDSYLKTEGEYNPDTLVAPGADDNASGVSGILTTARILSNYDFERTIIYANWNAEEFGLLGSAAFARECRADSTDIVAYFNLDMTGYLNPGDNIHIHLIYTPCDSLLGDFVRQVCHTYLPGINICQAWLEHGDTDFSSFNRNGYQAITQNEDVHHMSPYIHTVDDIIGLSVNNFEQSVVFTKLNLACVAHVAGLMYDSVDETGADNENIVSYEVYDLMGRRVYGEKNISTNIDKIRVTDLESGIYIMRFFTKNGNMVTKKIVK